MMYQRRTYNNAIYSVFMYMKSEINIEPTEIGWREWVALPGLGIPAIKAKVDTGARTSSLHTYFIESFRDGGRDMVRFRMHPLQKRTDIEIACVTPIIDVRLVKDSGGHVEERFVIETPVSMGDQQWPIEITLTNRDDMLFRMLLGRTAITAGQLKVNPERSYALGKSLKSIYKLQKRRGTKLS